MSETSLCNIRTGARGEKDAPRPTGWETDHSLEDGWGAKSVRASYYPPTPTLYAGEKAEAGDALGLAGFTLASCRKPLNELPDNSVYSLMK